MFQLISNPIGVFALSKREVHRFFAVAGQTIFPPLVSSVLFMYIFGVAIGSRLDFSATGISYLEFIIPGLMTMHLISNSYENTSASLFIARWHNHIQEILLSPLSYLEMVIGLLAGGVARGFIVSIGVYLASLLFHITPIQHPLLLLFFILTISVLFSCAGMMGALWAEDFGMLSIWNIYIIVPLVILGGVFHPMALLPEPVQLLALFNPMYYLVNGIRFSVTGVSDIHVGACALMTVSMMLVLFSATVYLFKVGYKLRT